MTGYKKILFPILTALAFSGSFVAAKYTTLDLKPLTTSFLRYLAALFFLCLLLFHFRLKSLKIARADLAKFFLLGLFGIVGYHYFFFLCLHYTTMANSAIINAFNPALTALLAALILGERLQWKNYAGLFLVLIGVLVLITRGHLQNLLAFNFNTGDLLMLLAVISWVLYSLIVKRLASRYSGFTITFYAALFGVLQLSALAATENFSEQVSGISASSVLAVLYMGIVASGIGYLLYNLAIAGLGPTRTSGLVYSLVPIFVAVLGWLVFREPITLIILLCTIVIIAGLNLTLRESGRRRPD